MRKARPEAIWLGTRGVEGGYHQAERYSTFA
jgi:hypothetical protein